MLTISDINYQIPGNLGDSFCALGGDPETTFLTKEGFMKSYIPLLSAAVTNSLVITVSDCESEWESSYEDEEYWNSSSSCY